MDVAAPGNDLLYVISRGLGFKGSRGVDAMCRIGKTTIDEDHIGDFARGQFTWPCGIDVSNDGDIYVSDEYVNTISWFADKVMIFPEFDLKKEREENKRNDTAIVRLEQLYPVPKKQMAALKASYKNAGFVWVQEEPENMGAWTFMLTHYRDWDLKVVARLASASPATGSSKVHAKTQIELVKKAFSI